MRKKKRKIEIYQKRFVPSSAETIFTGHLVKKKKTDTIYSLQFRKFRNLNAARRIYNNNKKKRCRQKVYTSSGERELES